MDLTYINGMETIIYFYQNKKNSEFTIEKWMERDYCLVRAGIPRFMLQSFREKTIIQEGQIQAQNSDGCIAKSEKEGNTSSCKIWKKVKSFMIMRKDCHQEKLKQTALVQDELLDEGVETQFAEQLRVVTFFRETAGWTYCVYEDSLRRILQEESLRKFWSSHWRIVEFQGYREKQWVELLVPYMIKDDFVILGFDVGVLRVLDRYVGNMRSVKWFLLEREDTEELEDWIEDFYEDTGLAIEVYHVESTVNDTKGRKFTWSKQEFTFGYSVNVLDYTAEEKVSVRGLRKGSVWLDMDSIEGKEERITHRNPDIIYFSLKKLWKMKKKEDYKPKTPIILDTADENGYNT